MVDLNKSLHCFMMVTMILQMQNLTKDSNYKIQIFGLYLCFIMVMTSHCQLYVLKEIPVSATLSADPRMQIDVV